MSINAWTGWIRLPHDKKWQPVCSAGTWGACWNRLLPIRPEGPSCDKLVLPSHLHPDRRRRPR